MNRQTKSSGSGQISRGIEWCDYTWNVIAGCQHRCRWTMPDGRVAVCYAETVANGVARAAYPHGFEYHYVYPHRLNEPLRIRQPAKIFADSMSDLFGRVVPDTDIEAVLEVMGRASWHTFQTLTKNAPRLLRYRGRFPPNLWVGVSSPPDSMFGHALSRDQQARMLRRSLAVLRDLDAPVRWMSFEPLSWDVADIVAEFPGALQWAVIGAATNGPTVYLPESMHLERLLAVLDAQRVPVFFKGNLVGHPLAHPWREHFPDDLSSPEPSVVQQSLSEYLLY